MAQNSKYILPAYFRGKFQLIGMVTFTALFSLVFLLVSVPFSRNAWFQLGASEAFAYTAAFFGISLGIIILSKRIMYSTREKFRMTYTQYVLWNICEIILISNLYALLSIKGNEAGVIHLENTSFLYHCLAAAKYAFVSLAIPYIISGMFFALVDKNKTIRLMNLGDVVSDEPVRRETQQQITLFDNSGVMRLSVSINNLYYIESDDNYVMVWYSDSEGEMKKYMLRCRLKTIEESFKDSDLVRCHRKYIINMSKVKVIRKEKDGYEIDLDNDAIPPISITKTYADNVLSRFTPMKG